MNQVISRFILQEDFNKISTRNNLQPNTNLIKEANPSSSCKLDLPLNLDLIQQMSLVHNVKARFKPKPNQNHLLQLGSLAWHFVFSGKITMNFKTSTRIYSRNLKKSKLYIKKTLKSTEELQRRYLAVFAQ